MHLIETHSVLQNYSQVIIIYIQTHTDEADQEGDTSDSDDAAMPARVGERVKRESSDGFSNIKSQRMDGRKNCSSSLRAITLYHDFWCVLRKTAMQETNCNYQKDLSTCAGTEVYLMPELQFPSRNEGLKKQNKRGSINVIDSRIPQTPES